MQPFRSGVVVIEELEGAHEAHNPEHAEEHHVLRHEGHQQCGGHHEIRQIGESQEEPMLVPLDVEASRKIEGNHDGN